MINKYSSWDCISWISESEKGGVVYRINDRHSLLYHETVKSLGIIDNEKNLQKYQRLCFIANIKYCLIDHTIYIHIKNIKEFDKIFPFIKDNIIGYDKNRVMEFLKGTND